MVHSLFKESALRLKEGQEKTEKETEETNEKVEKIFQEMKKMKEQINQTIFLRDGRPVGKTT